MGALQTDVDSLSIQMGKIAGIISSDGFPTGERAALRRMIPSQPLPMPFYRFAFNYLPEGWDYSLGDWVAIIAGIALMSPNAYNPKVRFGRALAEAGFSELRLERLLSAENETRRVLFLRSIRYLSSKGMPFNWTDGARFLLTRDIEKRENLHLSIGRDFYDIKNDRE